MGIAEKSTAGVSLKTPSSRDENGLKTEVLQCTHLL